MAEKFDRTKFRGAKMSVQAEYQKEIQEKANIGGSGEGNDRVKYFSIETGKNVFRIAPPHNHNDPAFEAKSESWLTIEIEKDGKKEMVRRPILNAIIHGGLKKDPVEEYVNYIYNKYKEQYSDKTDLKKKLAPVFGWEDMKGWHSGIKPSVSWVGYAWKDGVLGRVDLRPSIMNRMNELSIDEEATEPISIDPFSDPDEGVSLIIVYDPTAHKTKRYKVNRGINPSKLTDEQLIELSEQEPLKDMLRNQYDMNMFNKAVDGLLLFDQENKFGIFNDQEFLDILAEIKDKVPEAKSRKDEDADEEAAPIKSTTKSTIKNTSQVKEVDKGKLISECLDYVKDKLEALTDIEGLIEFVKDHGLDVRGLELDGNKSVNRNMQNICNFIEDEELTIENICLFGNNQEIKKTSNIRDDGFVEELNGGKKVEVIKKTDKEHKSIEDIRLRVKNLGSNKK